MPATSLVSRAIIEARKSRWRKPNWHPSSGKVNLNDPKTRIIFIVTIVAAVVLTLFLIGLVIYGRKEWSRKKDGKKPRWGRVLVKSLLLATLLAIPIWLIKKCRRRGSKGSGKYNKLDGDGQQQQYQQTTQTQWYGNAPAVAPPPYVGAGPDLHGYTGGYGYGGDVKSASGPAAPLAGSETYYDPAYGAAAAATPGYVPPRYDPPPSLPADRAVSPAAGVHQLPPPEGRN